MKHWNYLKKETQLKDLPKTWVSRGKQVEDFRQKKERKNHSRSFKKTQWNTSTPKTSIERGPRKQ